MQRDRLVPTSKAAPLPKPIPKHGARPSAPLQVLRLVGPMESQPVVAGPRHVWPVPQVSQLHPVALPWVDLRDREPQHHSFIRQETPLPVPVVSSCVPSSLQPAVQSELDDSWELVPESDDAPDWSQPLETQQKPAFRKRKTTQPDVSQTFRIRHSSASPVLMEKWKGLLHQLGPHSALFQQVLHSEHRDLHLARVLDGVAPSTALKYMSASASFLDTCQSMRIPLDSLTDVLVADVLLTISLARSSTCSGGSGVATIKALRWLQRTADVSVLQPIHSTLVQSFVTRKVPKDKREAPPLPLWVLLQWERRILMSSCPVAQVIILGSFLVMAWASLRFSDCQRVELQKLVLSSTDLRGIVWRSKTSIGGLPFGLLTHGFLSHGSHSWVWKFLTTLDDLYYTHDVGEVDFLLPDCGDVSVMFPVTPMSYATALYFLRAFLHCPWSTKLSPLSGLDLSFTVHSLKATMLSWGPQISAFTNREHRLQQGHHADPQSSLEVYSRDSVWGSLAFQRQVVQQVLGGWRPMIAQHRGSQRPLVEPSVTLERFVKVRGEFTFRWFTQNNLLGQPAAVDDSMQNVASESSDTSSDSSSESPVQSPVKSKPLQNDEIDEIIIGQYRSVLHAMVLASSTETWRPQHEGRFLKPACGRAMKASESKILDRIDASMRLCQHAACRKAWRALDKQL